MTKTIPDSATKNFVIGTSVPKSERQASRAAKPSGPGMRLRHR
jgi:hypothetical protein